MRTCSSMNARIGSFKAATSFSVAGMLACASAGCSKEQKAAGPGAPEVTLMTIVQQDVPIAPEYVAQTQSSRQVNIHARVSGFLDKRVYTEGEIVKEGADAFSDGPEAVSRCSSIRPRQPLPGRRRPTKPQSRIWSAPSPLLRRMRFRRRTWMMRQASSTLPPQRSNRQGPGRAGKAESLLHGHHLAGERHYERRPAAGRHLYQPAEQPAHHRGGPVAHVGQFQPVGKRAAELSRTDSKRKDSRRPQDSNYIVEIILVDGSIFPNTGKITFAAPSYNSQTGTFLLRASVDNPDGMLRPNQFVRVRLKGAVRPKAILVPQRAVQQGSKGHFVWVIDKDNKAEPRPVVAGDWHGNDWFITEGLKAGRAHRC